MSTTQLERPQEEQVTPSLSSQPQLLLVLSLAVSCAHCLLGERRQEVDMEGETSRSHQAERGVGKAEGNRRGGSCEDRARRERGSEEAKGGGGSGCETESGGCVGSGRSQGEGGHGGCKAGDDESSTEQQMGNSKGRATDASAPCCGGNTTHPHSLRRPRRSC